MIPVNLEHWPSCDERAADWAEGSASASVGRVEGLCVGDGQVWVENFCVAGWCRIGKWSEQGLFLAWRARSARGMAGGGARLLLALEQGLGKRRGLVRVAHLALDALGGGGAVQMSNKRRPS